jgi:hypothetical protein
MSIVCTNAMNYGNAIQFNNSLIFLSGNASISLTNNAMLLSKESNNIDYDSEDDCEEGCKWCVKHQNKKLNKKRGQEEFDDQNESPMKRTKKEYLYEAPSKKRGREGLDNLEESPIKRVNKEEADAPGMKRKLTAYYSPFAQSNKRARMF